MLFKQAHRARLGLNRSRFTVIRRRTNFELAGSLLCMCLLVALGAMLTDSAATSNKAYDSPMSLDGSVNNSLDTTPGGLASDAEINATGLANGQTDGATGGTNATSTTVSVTTSSNVGSANPDGSSTQVTVNGQPVTGDHDTTSHTSSPSGNTSISTSINSDQSNTGTGDNSSHTSGNLFIHSYNHTTSHQTQEGGN